MMKRMFLVMFMLLALIGFTLPAFATDGEVESYVVINSGTAAQLTLINTTTGIVPGEDRILGFQSSPYVSGAGTNSVAVFDNANLTLATIPTNTSECNIYGLFGEKVAANTASTADPMFGYPLRIKKGVAVYQGPGTVVTIYFERPQR